MRPANRPTRTRGETVLRALFSAHGAGEACAGAGLLAAPEAVGGDAGPVCATMVRCWGAAALSMSVPYLAVACGRKAASSSRSLAFSACLYHTVVSAVLLRAPLFVFSSALFTQTVAWVHGLAALLFLAVLFSLTFGFREQGPVLGRALRAVSPLHELLSLLMTRVANLRVEAEPGRAGGKGEASIVKAALRGCRVPQHVAIIMDGNRRYAREHEISFTKSYRAGGERLLDAVAWCRAVGVGHLTVFAFSCENWSRAEQEVGNLMAYFRSVLRDLTRRRADPRRRGVRMRFIGRRDRLAPDIVALMRRVEKEGDALLREDGTSPQDALLVSIAIDYSGKWDMVQAAQRMAALALDAAHDAPASSGALLGALPSRGPALPAAEVARAVLEEGGAASPTAVIRSTDAAQRAVEGLLCTAPSPPVDLLIRTGGDSRVSNFLLWQVAYAEIVVLDQRWPEVDEATFAEALRAFDKRERRFGK